MKKLLTFFSAILLCTACSKNIKKYPYVVSPVTYELTKKYDKEISKHWATTISYSNKVFTTDYFEVGVFNTSNGLFILMEYRIRSMIAYQNTQKFLIKFYDGYGNTLDTTFVYVFINQNNIRRIDDCLPNRYYRLDQIKRVEVIQLKSNWR